VVREVREVAAVLRAVSSSLMSGFKPSEVALPPEPKALIWGRMESVDDLRVLTMPSMDDVSWRFSKEDKGLASTSAPNVATTQKTDAMRVKNMVEMCIRTWKATSRDERADCAVGTAR